MNKTELAEKIKEIRQVAEREERSLIGQWNKENSPVKVGDVIENRSGVLVKVEKIRIGYGRRINDVEIFCCIYYGSLVKKNGESYKKPSNCSVHQSNVTKINGVPYAMEQD